MRRHRAPVALLTLTLASAPTTRALAQGESAPNDVRGPEATGEGATPAERAYNRSIAAYAAGDKANALAEMKESYRLSSHPELLYNIAKLERELGHCEGSLAAYRRYLKNSHEGEYHANAVNAERELAKQCDTPVPAEAPSYWTTPRILGWSAIGVAAVASGAAIYFKVSADAAESDVQRAVALGVQDHSVWTAQNSAREQDASSTQTAAVVSTVIAATFATGGVLLLMLPGRSERPPPTVSFVPQPGGGFAGYMQRF
jgi:hypothetical protein